RRSKSSGRGVVAHSERKAIASTMLLLPAPFWPTRKVGLSKWITAWWRLRYPSTPSLSRNGRRFIARPRAPRCQGAGTGSACSFRPSSAGFSMSVLPCRAPLRVEHALPVDALVGVRAEVVALGLEQVRREALAAVHVEVAERGAHRQAGDARGDGRRDDGA